MLLAGDRCFLSGGRKHRACDVRCEPVMQDLSPLRSGQRVTRLVHDNPSEPGAKACAWPETIQSVVRLEKSFLGDIFGVGRLTGDDCCQPDRESLVAFD